MLHVKSKAFKKKNNVKMKSLPGSPCVEPGVRFFFKLKGMTSRLTCEQICSPYTRPLVGDGSPKGIFQKVVMFYIITFVI